MGGGKVGTFCKRQKVRAPLSHISAGLTSFCIFVAADNELLSLHLERDPRRQAPFWNWGHKQKQGSAQPGAGVPTQGGVSDSPGSVRTCTVLGQ